ncbi:MAG TPA: MerR family transcriptional regulator [Ramlibacter sp.]|nr:MerR family transcriptional regulator [Ramlibacter sp.]
MPSPARPTTGVVDSVVELERATGIPRATLRVWERRYGFPQPQRDDRGRRTYDAAQLDKLRLIARLLARGARPGSLVNQSPRELRALLDEPPAAAGASDALLDLLRALDASAVLQHLLMLLAAQGLERFVLETVAPANARVGAAWAGGTLQPLEEHLYTECVQQVLRTAMGALAPAPATRAPRVLLTTPAGEQHGLGLLMAHALLLVHRCTCLPLGLGLPAEQIATAARQWRADVVALSISDVLPVRVVAAELAQLRAQLDEPTTLWLGGSSRALQREDLRSQPRVRVFASLGELPAAVAAEVSSARRGPAA